MHEPYKNSKMLPPINISEANIYYVLLLLFRLEKNECLKFFHGPKTPLVACVFTARFNMYLFFALCEQVYLFLAISLI